MVDEDFDAEDVLSSIGDDEIAKFLKDRGWHVYLDLSEIDDDDIENEYDERCLGHHCGDGDFSRAHSSDLQDELEGRGFVVFPKGEYMPQLAELYEKRLRGGDITEELEQIILEAANRIV
jgi:hypothetical protein